MATRKKTMERSTVVGIFENGDDARRAIEELHRAGFTDSQIGLISHRSGDDSWERHSSTLGEKRTEKDDQGTYAEEGAVTGALAGAGVGAAWAIGIAAGLLPAIGPVIAGGTLAALLASAGVGAAAGGLAGALVGMGIPEEEAEYYESEFKAGRTIVSVRANGRYDEAAAILRRHRGHAQERTGAFTRADFPATTHTAAPAPAHRRDLGARETAASTSSGAASQGDRSVKLREEEVHVHKQPVQSGEVQVRKEVVTEHKTVEVPVKREEVVISRHPAAGNETATDDIRGNETIRVPVKEEQVSVEKTPVVKEEISIGKRTIEDTETVSEDVKRERVRVDRQGEVNVRGENERDV